MSALHSENCASFFQAHTMDLVCDACRVQWGFAIASAPQPYGSANQEYPHRPLTIVESPYAGNVDLNIVYAQFCVYDSLRRSEAPFASHLLYTQKHILEDAIPEERTLGIEAGLAFLPHAARHAFYIDLGISPGMAAAWERGKVYTARRTFRQTCRRLPPDLWENFFQAVRHFAGGVKRE